MTNERPSYSVRVSSYPIEGGAAITDHVEPQLVTLHLTGLLVGNDAAKKRKEILDRMNAGEMVKYVGRNSFVSCIIESFESGHEYKTSNGMSFTMQLREIRKVKPLFSKKLPVKTQTLVKVMTTAGRKQVKTTKNSKSKGKKPKNKGPTGKKHTVRENQTWEALAYTYKVALKTLRSWNPQIPKRTRLKAGMVVIVG
ncbi:LysM peptidoglycan-binding domain-containing protein [Paenibacillus profundus]|uniref:LysM peptidoglycan-binding domain-containing protein n=1 Tax=Paenibacillus profundus TaxID=1173085 RepID=A0ABS8Y9I8_9BACL|nr:LysM domain-containing protein [Paenibacillus profundus]MCE5168530.1 LysM peptidoglycan-binding domain-containing protein [Paenibacillus profundus]